MRSSGEKFHTSSSFTTYLEKAFERRNGGMKFSTTTVHKSLINWLIDNEKDEGVRASVARLMSHNKRVQRLRYNTLDPQRRLKRGAEHLA